MLRARVPASTKKVSARAAHGAASRNRGEEQAMASTDLDLCYLTATEAIDQFKAKKLSPVELMKALLARCEAVNPKLNVLTYTFAERALEQAKAAETRYMKGDTRPLEGVPVAIKDFHPVRGEITTFGSLVYKNFRPDNTAPTIERLFDAGA